MCAVVVVVCVVVAGVHICVVGVFPLCVNCICDDGAAPREGVFRSVGIPL